MSARPKWDATNASRPGSGDFGHIEAWDDIKRIAANDPDLRGLSDAELAQVMAELYNQHYNVERQDVGRNRGDGARLTRAAEQEDTSRQREMEDRKRGSKWLW